MKRPFILVLMLAFFALLLSSGVSVADEKRVADKKPTEPPRSALMKVTPKSITGKVTQVDEKTKTVVILGQDGKKVTLNFSAAKAGACTGGRRLAKPQASFPKVGDSAVARVSASSSCEDCLATC